MIILKFGGTSVNSVEKIKTIASIVQKEKSYSPVVVVSAIRGVTDILLSLCNVSATKQKIFLQKLYTIHQELIESIFGSNAPQALNAYIDTALKEIEKNIANDTTQAIRKDTIIAYGEKFSSHIVSFALLQENIATVPVSATECIVTNDHFGSAEFIPSESKRKTRKILLPLIKKGIVPIITGYIGATKSGQTTTLGRGGSDYSASILGFCLGASEIQIWTDVDGIYSADPRRVKKAIPIGHMSYEEASELAAFGAKILHPSTLRPAIIAKIPVWVKSILYPEKVGTCISDKKSSIDRIRAVASKHNITLINIHSTDMLFRKGFLQKVFSVFETNGISIDLISVSEVNVSVTLNNEDNLQKTIYDLSVFSDVTIQKNNGIISLIGEGIVNVDHAVSNIFSILDKGNIGIKMVSLGATNINISLVVPGRQTNNAIQMLHDDLLLSQKGAAQ